MTERQADPPRLAQALLRAFVLPLHAESIPDELLEQYREVKRPSLGKRRADWWYVKHALGALWRIVWPCLVAVVALRILTLQLPRGWNPFLVQAPGVSLLDALIYVCAGFYASQRTNRIASGIVTSGLTSIFNLLMFFIYATVRNPSLLLAFEKPVIFAIAGVLTAIAVGFGIAAGAVGAAAGRGLPPAFRRARSV